MDKLPVGTILPYVGDLKDIPKKWALCDGTKGTPDLRDGRFLEGSFTPKTKHEAGLPNIKGAFFVALQSGGTTWVDVINGSVRSRAVSTSHWIDNNAGYVANYTFDINASRSSSIYSDSVSTVQPKSYTVFYIMKVKK